jgi:2-hydroxychromene-2-carboxylate isomerase
MKTIRFHFDFLSPYAYLAWTQIHPLAARHGRVVEPVPILFAALLNEHGTKGPAEVPARRSYLFKDITRTALRLGVPLAPPATHPFNPLLALRVAGADLPEPQAANRIRLIDRLFAAVWAEGRPIYEPRVIAEIAAALGLDGDALLAAAASDEGKARVRRQTEQALAAGIFGVPSMIVDGELFWGFDAFANLELLLEGREPDWSLIAPRLASLRASASRI